MSGFVPAPDWLDDLVIYELSTRNFTSPNGPESGTFKSLQEKLPYLRDVGITGIWLTGHNWADDSHFYNIWTQYAVIRPDVIDERLGTEDDFKELIKAAHDHGIKVFLDVITHGVMNDSPLTREHPEWFKEGTWGMTDYDWYGDHEDLFSWWVDTWVRFVTEFGVEGYRLDVSMYRPDLWQEIRQKCSDAGHPIIVFHELGPEKRGVLDFLQWDLRLKFNTQKLDKNRPLIRRMPHAVIDKVKNDLDDYFVIVEMKDGTQLSTNPIEMGDSPFGINYDDFTRKPKPSLRLESKAREENDVENPRTGGMYGEDRIVLSVTGIPGLSGPKTDDRAGTSAQIENITVINPEGYIWRLHGTIGEDYKLSYEITGDLLTVRFPPRYAAGSSLSIQLSCHDDGWVGFDTKSNPYVAGGSRFIFGYGFLFVPAVPIFMSGEEFDADFVPNPRLSPDLYGKETPGTGTWLYGSRLQWDQVNGPPHRDMLKDVKKLITIRRDYSHLIRPLKRERKRGSEIGRTRETFFPISDYSVSKSNFPESSGSESYDFGNVRDSLPVPYCYCDETTLLVIAGNSSTETNAHCTMELPLEKMQLKKHDEYSAEPLFGSESGKTTLTRDELKRFSCDVGKDNTKGGGVAVWKISAVSWS